MPCKKLVEFLETHHVKYDVIPHPLAYTAQGVAAAAHISGREIAKAVVVKIDGKLAMAVVPAPSRVDVNLLKQATGARNVELASEQEFADKFPECEPGAQPPFGNLYGMDTIVGEKLTEDEQIAFNAGTHREVVRLAYKDFEKLVQPKVAKISV